MPHMPALPFADPARSGFGAPPLWTRGSEEGSGPSLAIYQHQCAGGKDATAQEAWLAALGSGWKRRAQQLIDYLRGVYGANATNLSRIALPQLAFFWNNVPGRASFNVSWLTVRCAILGLFRAGALWAPIDDAQHNPVLLTMPMLERCARAACAEEEACLNESLRSARAGEQPTQVVVPPSQLIEMASNGMRVCLARGLEALVDVDGFFRRSALSTRTSQYTHALA